MVSISCKSAHLGCFLTYQAFQEETRPQPLRVQSVFSKMTHWIISWRSQANWLHLCAELIQYQARGVQAKFHYKWQRPHWLNQIGENNVRLLYSPTVYLHNVLLCAYCGTVGEKYFSRNSGFVVVLQSDKVISFKSCPEHDKHSSHFVWFCALWQTLMVLHVEMITKQ